MRAPLITTNTSKKSLVAKKTGTRKTRKDAVLVNELLVTSDHAFFTHLTPTEQRRFFIETLSFFSARYGKQNIAYAVVHVDERTPHMHLGVVPMRDGRLQGKNIFNRQELLWLQEQFPLHVQQQGFDLIRGEKGSDRTHIEMQQFKKQALEQEVATLTTQLTQKKQELAAFTETLPKSKWQVSIVGHEIQTNVIPHFIGRDEVIQQETRNIVITPEEIQKIEQVLQTASWVTRDYKRLLNVDLVQENQQLQARVQMLQTQQAVLCEQNEKLTNEVSRLRGLLFDLRDEIVQLYKTPKCLYKRAQRV